MRFSLPKTFQLLFRLLLIFSLIFIWVRYYSYDTNFAIWISLILTFCIEFFLNMIRKAKNKKQGLLKEEEQNAETAINRLVFNSACQNLTFFYQLLQKEHEVTKHKKYLLVQSQGKKFAFVPKFSFSVFRADDLIKILQDVKTAKPHKIIIATKEAEKQAKDIAKAHKTPIQILEKQAVYVKLIKQYDHFPTQDSLVANYAFTQSKTTLKDIAKNAINKNKTKSYFFSSVVLLFATYFVPYNIYYLVFATILLLLSLASFTSPWWKKVPKESIF